MTTPRNEVFFNLGEAESDIELTPPPPPPPPPVANIVAPAPAPAPAPVVEAEGEADSFEVEMERAKKKYIQEARKQTLERYEVQESKRAPRIQIDQRVVLAGWITAVAIAFLTSAIVSFNGITSVAVFVGLSQAWMASLFFFFIELMYLLFLLAYLILSSRISAEGEKEKTWGAISGMVFFAAVAVLANAFHTFDYWEWDFLQPRAWAGVVLSVSAPLAIISISKMASRVVFSRAVDIS